MLGHRSGEINALNGLGLIHRRMGRQKAARECFERVLESSREIGYRPGEFNALINLGHVNRILQAHERATEFFERTLSLAETVGSDNYRFEGLIGLGQTYHHAGDHDRALARYLAAIDLVSSLEQPKDRIRAEHAAALACRSLGRDDDARRHWRKAHHLLTELGIPGMEEVSTAEIENHLSALRA